MLDFGLIKDSDDDFDVDAEVTRVLVADFEKEGLLKMRAALAQIGVVTLYAHSSALLSTSRSGVLDLLLPSVECQHHE